MKILIAEDEATNREMLSVTLDRLNHDVTVANDGKQAWEILQQRKDIEVVISDWVMPEMDGLELCARARALRRRHYTYVILLTVKAGKENHLKGMHAGADDFISKPLDQDLLESRLIVAGRILELRYQVFQLERLLPICSYCKNIRDDEDNWLPVEQYIASRTGADFSLGICPTCYDTELRVELDDLPSKQ